MTSELPLTLPPKDVFETQSRLPLWLKFWLAEWRIWFFSCGSPRDNLWRSDTVGFNREKTVSGIWLLWARAASFTARPQNSQLYFEVAGLSPISTRVSYSLFGELQQRIEIQSSHVFHGVIICAGLGTREPINQRCKDMSMNNKTHWTFPPGGCLSMGCVALTYMLIFFIDFDF